MSVADTERNSHPPPANNVYAKAYDTNIAQIQTWDHTFIVREWARYEQHIGSSAAAQSGKVSKAHVIQKSSISNLVDY